MGIDGEEFEKSAEENKKQNFGAGIAETKTRLREQPWGKTHRFHQRKSAAKKRLGKGTKWEEIHSQSGNFIKFLKVS